MKSTDFPDLAAMRTGVEYSFPINCRGRIYRVRPLTCLEVIQASAKTAEDLEKLPENQRIGITASLLNAMNQLERASAPDTDEPGEMSLMLMQKMTPDEINHLWKQYVRVTDLVNPDLEKVPLDKIQEIIEDLKKNSEPALLLTDLSISHLIAVCLQLSKINEG